MDPFSMVVAIVLIGSVAGVVDSYFKHQRRSQVSVSSSVQTELQQVRREMTELRQSTHDVVLSFETTLQRLDARVENLERQALASGAAPGALSSGVAAGSVSSTPAEPVVISPGR